MNCQNVVRLRPGYTATGPDPGRRGSALLAVVPVAILVLAMMVAFVGTSIETSRANVSDMESFRAKAAAQNAVSMAIAKIWGDYEAASGGREQLWSFRSHLEGLGVADQGQGQGNPARTPYGDRMNLAKNERGRIVIDGVEIERLDVYRIDEWDATTLVLEVDAVARRGIDGSSAESRSSVQEFFSIAPPAWEGLDYALLANNINCLLCHTTIDSAERFYNGQGALAGTFDAVKIGSLESIHFRADPDSRIAGVALIGGDAIQGDGTNIADWSKFNLQTARQSSDGKILEDHFLDPLWERLSLFNPNTPDQFASVHLDFFQNSGISGYELPSSFPSPFPDNGGYDPATGQPVLADAGNRVVDDYEFLATVGNSTGTVSGGNISVVPRGEEIESNSEWARLKGGTDPSISGLTAGHVFMHGTKGNPIILDGDVAIDGDVIISGYVVGSGTIRTRGNVYVPGNLIYDDAKQGGNRLFGVAGDGRSNNLAVAAGGNIVIGDFYRPAWGEGPRTNGEQSGSFNFTMDELAIFNRQEWMKTQPTLPGEPEHVQIDTKTVWYNERIQKTVMREEPVHAWVNDGPRKQRVKYKWIWVSNGKTGEYEVKTRVRVEDGMEWFQPRKRIVTGTRWVSRTQWVNTGRRLSREDPVMAWVTPQHPNPYYNPSHIPRYYSFAEGTTVPIFNKSGHFDPVSKHWMSDEHAGEWNSDKLSYANVDDDDDPYLYDESGKPKAVVSTIAPEDDWISPQIMEKIVFMAQNGDGGKTIEVDATLYSANSILGTIPATKSTHTDGTLIVNGGIVAADVGILAPRGTQVNFDGRGARALSITADNGLAVRRRLSAPLPNL